LSHPQSSLTYEFKRLVFLSELTILIHIQTQQFYTDKLCLMILF